MQLWCSGSQPTLQGAWGGLIIMLFLLIENDFSWYLLYKATNLLAHQRIWKQLCRYNLQLKFFANSSIPRDVAWKKTYERIMGTFTSASWCTAWDCIAFCFRVAPCFYSNFNSPVVYDYSFSLVVFSRAAIGSTWNWNLSLRPFNELRGD